MADSADDLLKQARQALFDWTVADDRTDAEWNASARLNSAFEMLDHLLSSGGPLPADWADCVPVINVVSHIPDIVDLPDGDQVFAPPPRTALVRKLAEKDAEIARRGDLLAKAVERMQEKDAEIHRLTAELDATRNVPVEYVITAGLEAAMAADPHRADGDVLRETDGQKRAFAWKAATREWERMP